MSVVDAFATLGGQLVSLASSTGRSTKGTFVGGAAPVLTVALAYCRAALNGYRLLANDPGMTVWQQLGAMEAASLFEDALGTLCTSFGTSASVATLSPIVSGNQPGGGLAAMFPVSRPPVTVTAAAQAALVALQADPLSFDTPAAAAVKKLMAAAVAGITITGAA